MIKFIKTFLYIVLSSACSVSAYDAGFLFALQDDLTDFSVSQPLASNPIQVGGQKFYPFMNRAGRFIAATTRAGLLETMEPATLAYGRLNAKRLVSFGLAGALNDRYKPGDVVIVRSVARHDRGSWTVDEEFVPKSTEAGVLTRDTFTDALAGSFIRNCEEAGLTVHDEATLVSGDSFISAENYRSHLAETFGVDLVDMNSAAFLAVSKSFQRPCLIIRVVSDRANPQASEDFSAFVKDRSKVLSFTVKALAVSVQEMTRE